MKEFPSRLKALRKEFGLKQHEVATDFGLSDGGYQCYEQGTREPPLDMLVKLADVLEVPTDYLLCRDLSLLKSFDGFQ